MKFLLLLLGIIGIVYGMDKERCTLGSLTDLTISLKLTNDLSHDQIVHIATDSGGPLQWLEPQRISLATHALLQLSLQRHVIIGFSKEDLPCLICQEDLKQQKILMECDGQNLEVSRRRCKVAMVAYSLALKTVEQLLQYKKNKQAVDFTISTGLSYLSKPLVVDAMVNEVPADADDEYDKAYEEFKSLKKLIKTT